MATKPKDVELTIPTVNKGRATFHLLGTSPFLHNSMSAKARREFLLPAGRRRTTVERAATLKHDPIAEYRNSAYVFREASKPTLLCVPATAFKSAMGTAALDLPGARKTEVNRLCWVNTERVAMWGVPALHMAIVRSADMAHTPDIRTRAIVRDWCVEIEVEWQQPKMNGAAIVALLSGAGMTAGVGDGRPEKGKLSFGQFMPVTEGMPEWQTYRRIQESGGREAQLAAMENPLSYDEETEELLSWFQEELDRRGAIAPSGKFEIDEFEDEVEPA